MWLMMMMAWVPIACGMAIGLLCARFAWGLLWEWSVNAFGKGGDGGRLPPGSMGLPVIGETVQFMGDMRGFLRRHHLQYGTVFRTHLLGCPTVVLSNPDDAKLVFLGEGSIVEMRLMKPINDLLQGSLLSQHGHVHHRNRRLFQRIMSPSALSSYIPIAGDLTADVISQWPSAIAFDIDHDIHRIVFRLSQTVVMGAFDKELNRLIDPLFKLYNQGMMSLPINLPYTNYGKALRARHQLLAIFDKELHSTERASTSTGFLNVLIDAARDGELEEQDMAPAQMVLALLAAYETTSLTLNVCLFTIASRPAAVNALTEEIIEQLGDGPLRDIDMGALKRCLLLDATISEAMRMHSPVVMAGRVAIRSFETVEGFIVPAGWSVYVGADALQTVCSRVARSDEFLPERFLPGKTRAGMTPSRWEDACFGGGTRGCVGKDLGRLMVKMVIIEIIRRFRIELERPEQVFSKKHLHLRLHPRR